MVGKRSSEYGTASGTRTREFQAYAWRRYVQRPGISAIELIVSAVVLLTVMTFVTTICFRTNQLWHDVGYHRVAIAELSNQLDRLTRLSRDDAVAAMKQLQPSQWCRQTLSNPEIVSEINDDSLGTRIVLRIDWQRRHAGQPLELAGWLTRGTVTTAEQTNIMEGNR